MQALGLAVQTIKVPELQSIKAGHESGSPVDLGNNILSFRKSHTDLVGVYYTTAH